MPDDLVPSTTHALGRKRCLVPVASYGVALATLLLLLSGCRGGRHRYPAQNGADSAPWQVEYCAGHEQGHSGALLKQADGSWRFSLNMKDSPAWPGASTAWVNIDEAAHHVCFDSTAIRCKKGLFASGRQNRNEQYFSVCDSEFVYCKQTLERVLFAPVTWLFATHICDLDVRREALWNALAQSGALEAVHQAGPPPPRPRKAPVDPLPAAAPPARTMPPERTLTMPPERTFAPAPTEPAIPSEAEVAGWEEAFAHAKAQLAADSMALIVPFANRQPCLVSLNLSERFNIRDLNVDVLNSVDYVESDIIQAYFVNVAAGTVQTRVTFGSVQNAQRFVFAMVQLARLCGSPMRLVPM